AQSLRVCTTPEGSRTKGTSPRRSRRSMPRSRSTRRRPPPRGPSPRAPQCPSGPRTQPRAPFRPGQAPVLPPARGRGSATDRAAVHDRAFVVETFDRAPWREESDLEGDTLVVRATIDPLDDIVVRARLGLDRGPASIEQDPDGGAATRRRERGFQERIRDVTPQLV